MSIFCITYHYIYIYLYIYNTITIYFINPSRINIYNTVILNVHCSCATGDSKPGLHCHGSSNLLLPLHFTVVQVGQTLAASPWRPSWQGSTTSAATTTLNCLPLSTYWRPLFRSIRKWAGCFVPGPLMLAVYWFGQKEKVVLSLGVFLWGAYFN